MWYLWSSSTNTGTTLSSLRFGGDTVSRRATSDPHAVSHTMQAHVTGPRYVPMSLYRTGEEQWSLPRGLEARALLNGAYVVFIHLIASI